MKDYGIDIFMIDLRRTSEISFQKHEPDSRFWLGYFDLLFRLVTEVFREYSIDVLKSNLTYLRILEVQRSINWGLYATFSGAYEQAIRELRFVLEDVVQAIHIDRMCGDEELDIKVRKINTMRKKRHKWSDVVHGCDLPEAIEKKVRSLYGDLSGFIHPSFERVHYATQNPRPVFKYKSELFELSRNFSTDVYDVVCAMFVLQFPEASDAFFAKAQELIRSLNCYYTSISH
jgi:hypothetical protein